MAIFDGGCECGAVHYRMTDEPIFVNCCHCRQCQRYSGSAFALNAMIETDRLGIVQGRETLAIECNETRCSRCRVLLWAKHDMFGNRIHFLRVGTLDTGERIKPDAHFFTRSKHPWIAIPDNVQSFEALPTEGDTLAMSPKAQARLDAARSSQLAVKKPRR